MSNAGLNPLPGKESYTLPDGVKMILDATIQQATAFGVVLALFAGGVASIAQTLGGTMTEEVSPDSWKVLRVFLYSAIMFNLSGAFISLMIVKMCTDLSLAAWNKKCRPAPSPENETVSRLLRRYNMSNSYWIVERLFVFVSIFACVFTFTALSLWVFLSEPLKVAGATMAIFSALGIAVLLSFWITIRGENWK
ncbi:hypothetical protein M408DRAFT_25201 [Serendipita vermifera MAFF 305830]|uniref:Uncharacterized protein n=1 Tax=Serendipita vermifera MAFF 305830 TaxID=933852 RepID=A0A0C2XC61_SERVB|nr:hypothetical protein M408DRAFT_25201 [Serendipita vermifera MAFF 305830]